MNRNIYYHPILIIVLAIIALTACRDFGGSSAGYQQLPSPYTEPADYYLSMAAQSPAPENSAYQLKAVGRLIDDKAYARAQQVLQDISPATLPNDQYAEYSLLAGQVSLWRKQPKTARSQLARINNPAQLTAYQRIQYHQTLADAYAIQQLYLDSAREHIQLDSLLPDGALRQTNRQQIWQQLSQIPTQELHAQSLEDSYNDMSGWLALAYITKQHNNGTAAMQHALNNWRMQYPNHPALQAWSTQEAPAIIQQPQHIALLVPLQGELVDAGNEVRDGFMAAYYQHRQESAQHPQVKVYDTSYQSVKSVYQQALAEGADMVVGPLPKEQVSQLATQRMTVPTIALNYTARPAKQMYQFGLAPQDEAEQVAAQAAKRGLSRALVITGNDDWQFDIEQAFTQAWQQHNGRIISHLNYDKQTDLDAAIKQLLGIDDSEARQKQLNQVLGKRSQSTPHRRQDVDIIFLIAAPEKAREILPLLKYYYAGSIPIYATSTIYSGSANTINDRDMDGVYFVDLPSVLAGDRRRLYALGFDAYQLTQELNRLALLPQSTFTGKTGLISLQENRQFKRQATWARFKNGKPQPITG
jgi:outer membrane PBP1 activator LpoA protein